MLFVLEGVRGEVMVVLIWTMSGWCASQIAATYLDNDGVVAFGDDLVSSFEQNARHSGVLVASGKLQVAD